MKDEIKRDIFNIFHDGSIIFLNRQEADIVCTVEIQYIAQLFDPLYTFFKVTLKNVQFFELKSWMDNSYYSNLEKIALLISEMEIALAKCQNDQIFIECLGDQESIGATLIFSCDEVIIYDQDSRRLPFEELQERAKSYWANLAHNE